MLPALLLGTSLALAAATGIYIIHDVPTPPRPRLAVNHVTAPAAPTAPLSVAAPDMKGATTTMVAPPTPPAPPALTVEAAQMLDGSADLLAALGMDRTMVTSLCRHGVKADSLVVSTTDDGNTVMIRIVRNGDVRDLVVPSGGTLPVMVTTAHGHGRVLSHVGGASTLADPNHLVPVSVDGGNGTNVVWFSPDADVIDGLPDSLATSLRRILAVTMPSADMDDIVVETDDVVRRTIGTIRSMQADGTRIDSLSSTMNIKIVLENDDSVASVDAETTINHGAFGNGGGMLNIDSLVRVSLDRVRVPDSLLTCRARGTFDSAMAVFDAKELDNRIQALMKDLPAMRSTNVTIHDSTAMVDLQDLPTFRQAMPTIDSLMMHLDSTMKIVRIIGGSDDSLTRTEVRVDRRIHRSTTDGSPATVDMHSRIIILRSADGRRTTVEPGSDVRAGVQETWRSSGGAVTSTSVYPNPTTDGGATVAFDLAQRRRVTLTLHDLTGVNLMTLARDVERPAGRGQLSFTLPGVPAGMYLVTLSTDRGERAVQRLIVQ